MDIGFMNGTVICDGQILLEKNISVDGDQNNRDISGDSDLVAGFVTTIITAVTDVNITGILNTPAESSLLYIYNESTNTQNLILKNLDGASEAVNQIVTGTGGDITLVPGKYIFLMYIESKRRVYSEAVSSVNGQTGAVILDTTDIDEGTNLYYTDARADGRIALQRGAVNGVASLDGNGKVPSSQLPAIAITDTFVVGSESAMLALSAQTGDIAVRTDLNKTYILEGTDPTVLADWQELLTPTDTVLSVNGQTGAVSLSTTNISEGSNLYYTDERVDDRANSLIVAGSSKLSKVYDDPNNTLTLDVVEGNLNIANMTGVQPNSRGGTGIDTSASTGIPKITTGTWTANATTTDLSEGSNLYYTDTRVRATVLTGVASTSGDVAASDTVLQGMGKVLYSQINGLNKMKVRVHTAAGSVTVEADDYVVVVNKSSGAATTVDLPAGTTGAVFYIKDGKGDSSSNNITIDGNASETIDGSTTKVINTDYGTTMLVWNGTQWNSI